MAGGFDDAVFAAPVGDVVGPLRTTFGWHVVLVCAAEPAGATPYDDVRAPIADELLAAARGERFDEWLAQRRAALVRFAPGYEHPGDPSAPDFVHRH